MPEAAAKKRLDFLKWRRLGISLAVIIGICKEAGLVECKEMAADGELTLFIVTKLLERDAGLVGIDWDGLIEFIESIMPLILMIIEILIGLLRDT